MGDAPQRAAKLASLRSRSGLSPAATSRAPAVSVPTPFTRQEAGRRPGRRGGRARRRGADLVVEGPPSAGDAGAGTAWRRRRGVAIVRWSPAGPRAIRLAAGSRMSWARSSSGAVSRTGCGAGWRPRAGLAGATAGPPAGAPERLDRARCGTWACRWPRPTSTARAAASASTGSDLPRRRRRLPVGSVDLDNLHARVGQVAGEARAPGARALDADPDDDRRSSRSQASSAR